MTIEKIRVKKLDRKRFNALAGHSRSAGATYISSEVGWYSNTDETVLGLVFLDTIDL